MLVIARECSGIAGIETAIAAAAAAALLAAAAALVLAAAVRASGVASTAAAAAQQRLHCVLERNHTAWTVFGAVTAAQSLKC